MAEVEFHLHNEVGIKFPPLRPAYSDGELYFGRFRGLVARSTGTSSIGEGGTGRIHLVRDELMEREVALKIPLDSILRDPAAREDVIQETRQAMDLTHPNIVRIHDFHEGDGKWGISMQYVRGKNLDEWRYDSENTGFRRAIRPYTVEVIRDWIAQLCDALRYAHEDARMVHRDIKPKNLMLEKREGGEKVFITDFGISQRLRLHTMMLSRDQTKVGESKGNMGTLPYMPWEQIAGAPASPLDDVYAVGATIYELITGRPPFYDGGFEQIKVQIREVPPPSMEQRILDLGLHMPPPPDEWEAAVAACLAKRPEDRPQSMRALAAALGFQSGSNTELEARVSSQSERINELETQIISLSHATAAGTQAGNPEAERELAAARQELAELNRRADQSQRDLAGLEAAMAAARQQEQILQTKLAAAEADRDAAMQGGDQALRSIQEEAARRVAEAEERIAAIQAELAAARTQADSVAAQARQELTESAQQTGQAQDEIRRLEAEMVAIRQSEADLAARLAATETERDSALKGGDQALRTFQEESARRISQAEERVTALQGEVAAAKAEGEALAAQVRQRAEQQLAELTAKAQTAAKTSEQELARAREEAAKALKQAKEEADKVLLQTRQEAEKAAQASAEKARREIEQAAEKTRKAEQEAEKAAQASAEKARREIEQAAEKTRKAEQEKDKAVGQVREEAEKRLQKQAEELEKTRQNLNKTVTRKEELERAVATERERQGASLKPLLVGLLVAMVLGLAGGFGWSAFRGSRSGGDLSQSQQAYLPKTSGEIAGTAVPFDLFEKYAAAIGSSPDQLQAKNAGGTVAGVNGLTAFGFCNWLTQAKPPAKGLHYTLPEPKELEGKVAKGTREWSLEWAKAGQTLLMRGQDASGTEGTSEVHVLHSQPDFTFRLALKPLPGS